MFSYLQSQILSLKPWFNTVNPIITTVDDRDDMNNSMFNTVTTVDDVDEKNDSSFDTVNPIITTVDDVDKSSINAGDPNGFEEPPIEKLHQEKTRARMVDWIFEFTAEIPDLPDKTYFLAVDILDCSLMKHAEKLYQLSNEEIRPVLIAVVKLAVLAVDEEALCALLSVIDELGYSDKDIKHWEDKHAKTFDFNTNAPKHMQSTHLLEVLHEYWSMICGIMKLDQFQSGWSMIETLTSFALSKASLMERHDSLLLASAIMRIALDTFASRNQLDEPLNSETIKLLLGKESDHVPVALELLDWILSSGKTLPALTEEMKDDFGFDAKSELRTISRHMWMSQV